MGDKMTEDIDDELKNSEEKSKQAEYLENLLKTKVNREVSVQIWKEMDASHPHPKLKTFFIPQSQELLSRINGEIAEAVKLFGETEEYQRIMLRMMDDTYFLICSAELAESLEDIKRFNGEYSNCHLCVQYPESFGCTGDELSNKPTPIKCRRGLRMYDSKNCNFYELKIDDKQVEAYRQDSMASSLRRSKVLEKMMAEAAQKIGEDRVAKLIQLLGGLK
jgi:hypothetical protein